jgi:hypothetical protein
MMTVHDSLWGCVEYVWTMISTEHTIYVAYVTLTTHYAIVRVFFGDRAHQVILFDILDVKFEAILGINWLARLHCPNRSGNPTRPTSGRSGASLDGPTVPKVHQNRDKTRCLPVRSNGC